MNQPIHTEAQQALQAALVGGQLPPFDEAFVAHVTGCAVCRAALLLLTTTIANLPEPQQEYACAQIEDDLAAFVELEAAEGAVVAARTYPHVWWHLWSCADCLETYTLLRAMQNEAQGAALLELPDVLRTTLPSAVASPSLPQPTTRERVLHRIELARSFLAAVFAPQPLLGTAHGEDEATTVLWEDTLEGRRVTVSVQQAADDQWLLLVAAASKGGRVEVLYGDKVLHTPLDQHGQGQVVLPQSLLFDVHAPDLTVSLVLDDNEGSRP